MCAIFGMGFLQERHGEKAKIKNVMIHKAISEAFKKAETRGRDASGIAVVTKKEIKVLKAPIQGSSFVKQPEYEEFVKNTIDIETEDRNKKVISILCHCRHQTKGTYLDNHNNHPILSDRVVGIHNGMVDDEELYLKYDSQVMKNRKGEVDSEVIFRLIEHFSRDYINIFQLKRALEVIKGSYACAAVHANDVYKLWLFRNCNPMVVKHFKPSGTVVFGSDGRYFESETEFGNSYPIIPKDNSILGFDLWNNEYITEGL